MAIDNDLLLTEINTNPISDNDKAVVRTSIKIIEDSKLVMNDYLNDLDNIWWMMKETFRTAAPDWNNQLPPYLLFQVVFNLVTQMKPLDIMLTTQNVSEERKRIVSQWLWYIAEKAWYDDLFNENYNWFWQQLSQWDFFAMVGKQQNWLPEFKPCDITGVYFDANATNLRGFWSNKLTRATIVFKMWYDQAIAQMPWIKDKATIWSLPSTQEFDQYQDLNDMEWEQDWLAQDREIEIGYYFDISEKPRFTIFAWRTAAIGVDLKWDEYPHYLWEWDTRENYIPLLQWLCFPTREWVLNAWFWHIIYPIAMKWQELTNKAINHVQDNMDPMRIVNVPKQQAPRFLSRVKDANKMRKKGQRPYIINDFWAWEQWAGVGQIETLQAWSMTADYERLLEQFKQMLTAFWVNLQTVNIDPNQPLGSVQIEEENKTEIIRQIQEGNTSTYRMAVEILMDSVKKLDEDADAETLDMVLPVNLVSAEDRELFEAAWQEAPDFEYTVRDLKEDIESATWEIQVSSRTWAYPSFTLEKARLRGAVQDMISIWEVDSAKKLLVKQHKLSWIDLGISTLPNQQPQWSANQVQEAAPEATAWALEALAW